MEKKQRNLYLLRLFCADFLQNQTSQKRFSHFLYFKCPPYFNKVSPFFTALLKKEPNLLEKLSEMC